MGSRQAGQSGRHWSVRVWERFFTSLVWNMARSYGHFA